MAWTNAVKIACHNALLTLVDTGAGAAHLDIYNTANTLLVSLALTDPAATPGSAQLVLTFDAAVNGAATGAASYAKFLAADDTVLEDNIPCQQGTSAVAGAVVMTTLAIISGYPVEGVTFTVG
jgi:hypothetical protein